MSDQDNGDNVDPAHQMFQGVTDEIQKNTKSTKRTIDILMQNSPSGNDIVNCYSEIEDLEDLYNTTLGELESAKTSNSEALISKNIDSMDLSVKNIISNSGNKTIENPNCIVEITIFYKNLKIYGLYIRCYIQPVNEENRPLKTAHYRDKLYTKTDKSYTELKNDYYHETHYFNNTNNSVKAIKAYSKKNGPQIYDGIEIYLFDEAKNIIRYPPNFSYDEFQKNTIQLYKVPTTFEYNNQNVEFKNHNQISDFSEWLYRTQNLKVIEAEDVKNNKSLYNEIIDLLNKRSNWKSEFYYLNSKGYHDVIGKVFTDDKYLFKKPLPEYLYLNKKTSLHMTYPFFLSKYWAKKYRRGDIITMFNFPSKYFLGPKWSTSYLLVIDGEKDIFSIGSLGGNQNIVLPNFDDDKLSDFNYNFDPSIKPEKYYEINNTDELEEYLQIFKNNAATVKENNTSTNYEILSNLKSTMKTIIHTIEDTVTNCNHKVKMEKQYLQTLKELPNPTEHFNNMNENGSFLNKIYNDILNNFKKMNSIKEPFDTNNMSALNIYLFILSTINYSKYKGTR